jgi:hypothetical protein
MLFGLAKNPLRPGRKFVDEHPRNLGKARARTPRSAGSETRSAAALAMRNRAANPASAPRALPRVRSARRWTPNPANSAQLVFGWSFYRQGSSGGTSSADEFLDAALNWFGESDPRIGTAWEKGERLARLIAHRRTLLVLDGLEPLQNPPGSQEGRFEPSLQALLRELAAFNTGLCVITTRIPVADIIDQERTSAPRRDLE